ncbi:hypothetical protein GWG65_17240 [Bradyrhizobium sp. CSA207]|nr:hypothetical protein [Bradyrhizobium sp. CSA207]
MNEWALSGDGTVRKDASALNKPSGKITYRFHARDLHLVMGPAIDHRQHADRRLRQHHRQVVDFARARNHRLAGDLLRRNRPSSWARARRSRELLVT